MSGLMMFFLAIAVVFMLKVQNEKEALSSIAETYRSAREDLYRELLEEFRNDLDQWGAEIDARELAIRFREPDVLFDHGSHTLKPEFRRILSDFFPRYVEILRKPPYRKHVREIRIEGHTSSDFGELADLDAYLANMELSQARTRATLEFLLCLPQIKDQSHWLRGRVTANGLSSSQLILTASGKEDRLRSRRVEFRVRTDAEEQIDEILTATQQSRGTTR
ncbi:MAG: OmpA family protein [bacterium]